MIAQKQLSLADIYADCQEIFENDKQAFLTTLEEHIDIDKLIPSSFIRHYHAWTGRKREYPLRAMLWALIIQRIFSIPTDKLLLIFLKYSKELREFCGFSKVPDASKITRFKQDFVSDLQLMFDHLVDVTEPICQKIDFEKAAMTIFDTSGIEAYVTENNPKYLNSLIKQMKNFKKVKSLEDSFDPHKAAYGAMPSHAVTNPAIQQMYINGHFCYSYKFGLITNGFGIVRDIPFFNKDYLKAHPDIIVEKKSDSPDEDKSLADSKALIPSLTDFFEKHPSIKPGTFIGDAAFDAIQIYHDLFYKLRFKKAYIPLNNRPSLDNADCHINENGIPCCPKDHSLPMKREGSKSHLRCGLPTVKFVCPKMTWAYNKETKKSKRQTSCDDPCTPSACGRMTYIYPEKDLRLYPGTIRGTEEWAETYKIRASVERSINHFKDSFGVANRKTQNEKTLHADLLLAGITQLITVVVADKIHRHDLIRSIKPLVA
jgi:transposase